MVSYQRIQSPALIRHQYQE